MIEVVKRLGDSDNRFESILTYIQKETPNVKIQEFNSDIYGSVRNIIIPATNAPKILLVAHHDVIKGSKGYNDNGSGVAISMNILKYVIKHNITNVEFLFSDKEEFGGIGIRHYLENNIKRLDKTFGINLDVCGLGDTIFFKRYITSRNINLPSENELDIPFSDSYVLQQFKVENVLFITGINDKMNLIKYIFDHQHNGILDNKIEELNEEIMQRVCNLVIDIIKED